MLEDRWQHPAFLGTTVTPMYLASLVEITRQQHWWLLAWNCVFAKEKTAPLNSSFLSRIVAISTCTSLWDWIDHFTVTDLVKWPLNGSEGGFDLVLIQTSLLLLCKSSCAYANQFAFTREKLTGLYQSKVTFSLACIHGQVSKHTTVKWPIAICDIVVRGSRTRHLHDKEWYEIPAHFPFEIAAPEDFYGVTFLGLLHFVVTFLKKEKGREMFVRILLRVVLSIMPVLSVSFTKINYIIT